MAAKMRLSEAAREKLKKEEELYEQTCYFISNFRPTKALDSAFQNIHSVVKDLGAILSSSSSSCSSPLVDDVSSMIIENRSEVEDELMYICDESYEIETEQAFKEFLVHFKQGDLSIYGSKVCAKDDDVFFSKYRKGGPKEKAPQITELERKQQKDADQKRQVCREKLYKESRLYGATLRSMLPFVNKEQVTNDDDHRLIILAYGNIMAVHSDLRGYISSHEVLCSKDVSLMLDGCKSKVQNALQHICDNVSNPTVQDAFTRYLDDFKTGLHQLSPQDHLSPLQDEDGNIISSKPKESVKKKKIKSELPLRGKSGSRSCKTPSLFRLDMNDYFPRDNHSKCCLNNDFASKWAHPKVRMALVELPRLDFELFDVPELKNVQY